MIAYLSMHLGILYFFFKENTLNNENDFTCISFFKAKKKF